MLNHYVTIVLRSVRARPGSRHGGRNVSSLRSRTNNTDHGGYCYSSSEIQNIYSPGSIKTTVYTTI